MFGVFISVVLWCLGSKVLGAVFNEDGCSYTFHVWHPDQDVLRQMKDLNMKYDNFSGHSNAEVAHMKAIIAQELRKFQNLTSHLEREILQTKVDGMQVKGQHSNLASDVGIIQRELDVTSRKMDDLEMEYFNLRTRFREERSGSSDGHLSADKGLGSLLKNSVGDLKAEWLLMKRELEDIRTENLQIKHGQNDVKNDTSSLRKDIQSVLGEMQMLETHNYYRPEDFSKLQGTLFALKNDLIRIKDSQQDLKLETNELQNEIVSLQTSNIRFQKDLHEMQIENTRFREKLESLGREELSRRETEATLERHESNLPKPDDFVARDCHELFQIGYTISGVYNIHPKEAPLMVSVYCEMVNKTGYTVVQRRIDGLTSFNRRWLEYRHGFGNPYGEFWFGNDLLHAITKQKQYILRIDMWDWEGSKAYAEYSSFAIDGEAAQFRLHVGGYHGDAGDSLSYHDNMAFSTEDVDNDLHTRHCAAENKGGWWFNSCYSSHLNGNYHTAWYSQSRSNYADGVVWFTWKKSEFYSVKKVEMKLRPKVP